MLDDRLTPEERRALLHLLTSVALADGKLSDAEVRFVRRLALPIGLDVGELLATVDPTAIDALCRELARPLAARIAVLELLRLAHADDVFAHVEQSTIAVLSKKLGVSQRTLESMEDWVHREWELLSEARQLVESG